jgi:GntR family transcriptional regulator/MocR family aminotransferase
VRSFGHRIVEAAGGDEGGDWYHLTSPLDRNVATTSVAMRAPGRPFIHIDPRRTEGLQTQIYRAVRTAILDGTLISGAKLLSSRALADDLRVSRTTTLLAYEQLIAEGYLTARHGSGTFVADTLPDDLSRSGTTTARAVAVHPRVSARGGALSGLPPSANRLPGPARAFRIGVPALDKFPHRLWARLVNRQLRRTTIGSLDYGNPAGERPLREAIAIHVSAARGTQCHADQVFIVPGAQRGLEIAVQTLLDPGDHAVVEDPGYPGAWSAFASARATRCPVAVDDEGIDVEAIGRLRSRPRLAYVTPSHQFPLGVAMSLPRRLALLRWARDADAWIVEDDYDSEYRYSARPIPCLHGLASDGRVVYLGSFSKTLFPALRLGFLIVPEDVVATLSSMRRAADVHPPVFDQLVLADLIAEGHYERHLRRMRALCRERLEALQDAVRRRCRGALHLRPVHAGLHAVGDLAADVDVPSFLAAAAAMDLEVMSLAAYSAGTGAPSQSVVLGFGAVDAMKVRKAVETLARAIDSARRVSRLHVPKVGTC